MHQRATLDALAGDDFLKYHLVFKGAALLAHFYGLPRYSNDLDFFVLHEESTSTVETVFVRQVHRRVVDVLKKTLPERFKAMGIKSQGQYTVKIELSPGDDLIAQTLYRPSWGSSDQRVIRGATLEDAVADRFLALLERSERRPARGQDVVDLVLIDHQHELNGFLIRRHLFEKVKRKAIQNLPDFLTRESRDKAATDFRRAVSLVMEKRVLIQDFGTCWDRVQTLYEKVMTAHD